MTDGNFVEIDDEYAHAEKSLGDFGMELLDGMRFYVSLLEGITDAAIIDEAINPRLKALTSAVSLLSSRLEETLGGIDEIVSNFPVQTRDKDNFSLNI
jgi:hypothetical protein